MNDIHPTAVIEDGAFLGEGVKIGPFCYVGKNAVVKDCVRLGSHVCVKGPTEIGAHTVVYSFSVLGCAPQHSKYDGCASPLLIGEHNVIHEHVTMSCGMESFGSVTRVGSHGLFMTGVHIAHDCVVSDYAVFSNQATLGGHVHVEDYVTIGGGSVIHQRCRLGAYSFVSGASAVLTDVIPFGFIVGSRSRYGALDGLNVVGMKRHGFSKSAIHTLRAAYKILFSEDGLFEDRLQAVARDFSDSKEVLAIVAFIRAKSQRSICFPKRDIKVK